MMFRDREDGGRNLAKALEKYRGREIAVLALPRGGIAAAFQVAKELKAPLEVVVTRKIPIPWNPEAGFGAVNEDGEIVLNNFLVAQLELSDEEIKELSKEVFEEIKRRVKKYRGDDPFPELSQKTVMLVDDGLASGYTMVAAINMVKKRKPKEIVVAVPCAPQSAINLVKPLVDDVICVVVQKHGDFAVASYYEDFHEMTDKEVMEYLKKAS